MLLAVGLPAEALEDLTLRNPATFLSAQRQLVQQPYCLTGDRPERDHPLVGHITGDELTIELPALETLLNPARSALLLIDIQAHVVDKPRCVDQVPAALANLKRVVTRVPFQRDFRTVVIGSASGTRSQDEQDRALHEVEYSWGLAATSADVIDLWQPASPA